MRRLQAIEQIQQQLMGGEISQVNLKDLQQLLGDPAEQSLNILLQLPDVLSKEGVADFNQKTGFDMTPRGMRALGETAFGKIYHHFKNQSRQGGHVPAQ